MKKIFLLPFLLISFSTCFKSCKKDSITKSKTQYLTGKTWIYDEYFRNYNSGNTVLYYKRGKSSNLLNLDINKVSFKSDGTYSEITETGTTVTGTWKFLNNETQVQVTNSAGIFTSTIQILNDSTYYWFDQMASNGTYGKMTSQD